jgi:putative FmdB family regulatory protein
MPIRRYTCGNCGEVYTDLQHMSDDSLTPCPKCGSADVKRMVAKGVGVILKGSGFYSNDYKKKEDPEP